MSRRLILALSLMLSISGVQHQARAAEEPVVRQVEYSPLQVEASPSYREGDDVKLTIKELFPHSCYKSGPAELRVTGKDIFLRDTAFLYEDRLCLAALYPYSKTVDLGSLPAGEYRVFLSSNGALKEETRITVQSPQ